MTKKASVSAVEIANAFLELAKREGNKLTNIQLQKLVYIAYGYFAALFNERLFDDDIEAWYFGPVIPSLYHRLKKYGFDVVAEPIKIRTTIETNSPEMKVVEAVWDSYKKYDSQEISDLTHQEGSPWSRVWEENKRNIKIPFNTIKHYYEKLVREEING